MRWHDALIALDNARANERKHHFSLESRLATIDVEIVERQAFAAHLREIVRDAVPGNSFEAGLRDA